MCASQELKKEAMEQRLVLDTVNEVSRALLELVPWRAREGLDKLVSDTNERYKLLSDTVRQRVEEIDAAIQRSQQVSWGAFLGLVSSSHAHDGKGQRTSAQRGGFAVSHSCLTAPLLSHTSTSRRPTLSWPGWLRPSGS